MMTKYQPTWESIQKYSVPSWYRDAKFGIFIHWGVYSVPAFENEWYPRNMYIRDSSANKYHRKTYGDQNVFGYKDFVPMFTAEKFKPEDWIRLFKSAGARYLVPVAEHHDGFAMYDCSYSNWNAAIMGPKQDVIFKLAQSARNHQLEFGVSSHRAENWWYFNGGREFQSDVQNLEYEGLYGFASPGPKAGSDGWKNLDWQPQPNKLFLEDWLKRTIELIDKYHPSIIWFDWWIEQRVFEPYLREFTSYYYNKGEQWGKDVLINFKHKSIPENCAVFDIERGQSNHLRKNVWQTDTSVSKNSWGYIQDNEYRSAGSLIKDLVDIVSKNGNLLLNVGPTSEGLIPDEEISILQEMGKWLDINGDAIFETRPWDYFGEGPTQVPEGYFTDTTRNSYTSKDIRFTTKKDAVFAIFLENPGQNVRINTIKPTVLASNEISHITMIGMEESLPWSQDEEGIRIALPDRKPGKHAWVFRIQKKSTLHQFARFLNG
jgi:alpha-L-fucosidase